MMIATLMYPRLTSSEILRGEEDLDELALYVHSMHFLAFSVAPEVFNLTRRGEQHVDNSS